MNLNNKNILFVILFFLPPYLASAQQLDHTLGQILIQSKQNNHIDRIVERYNRSREHTTTIRKIRRLNTPGYIDLIGFDHTVVHEAALLAELRRNDLVVAAQFNHLFEYRQTVPNDPSFAQQWFWVTEDNSPGAIDADLAWDISTGGTTSDGQEIVVAVIDDGIDSNHPDLMNNLWINNLEVPDNGLDDDGNGYIDDYFGWNINNDNDDIEFDPNGPGHGVTVAGMVGAEGNNNAGITGVNWRSKMMIVKNNDGITQSLALEAYAYPLAARKLYNETNGAKGAFVVATNASWGLNFQNAGDAPIWCNFYDSLGHAGIVNCAATTNLNINVDTDGDLPTTCPSEYLIAVTRTGINEEQGGGFGTEHIDLGAPGIAIYSTEKNSTYGTSTGTSLSSPLVAGMVAFLYSIPDNQLTTIAKTDPQAAATLARQYILNGVRAVDGYETLVATGGIANLSKSATMVKEDANACFAPFGLTLMNRTDEVLTLDWSTSPNVNTVNMKWRPAGSSLPFNVEENITAPFTLEGLNSCTEYEFELESVCANGSSGYVTSANFFTDGCCDPPQMITIEAITANEATINWESIFAAVGYEVDIRESGTTDWTTIDVMVNFLDLTDLTACTDYEIRIKTLCTGINSTYSPIVSFSTIGCGNCQDIPYCEVERNTQYEYIDKVVFAGVENQSGDNDGYAGFFTLPMIVDAGETYAIELTPGYPGFNYTDDFEVWIDYNLDGDFDDVDEKVLFIENTTQAVTGQITIPDGLPSSSTRMRVTIFFNGPSNVCEPQQDGETEDYCITINGASNECEAPMNLASNVIDDFTVFLSWEEALESTNYLVSWKELGSTVWQQANTSQSSYLLSSLSSCTEYDFRVRSNCSVGTSAFAIGEPFKTKCKTNTQEPLATTSFQVFPNPFTSTLFIESLSNEAQEVEITLYNIEGQLLQNFLTTNINAGYQTTPLAIKNDLASGIYILRIETDDDTLTHRIIKL